MIKELVIKISNDSVFLNPVSELPIIQSNFPIAYCKFKTRSDIFWKVELLEYQPENKCLKIKVIEYFPIDTNNFNIQIIPNDVERIEFENFEWPSLEQQLSSHQKNKFQHLLNNHDVNRFLNEEPRFKSSSLSETNIPSSGNDADLQYSSIETKQISFKFPFSEAQFLNGKVTFCKNIKELNRKVEFEIKNEHICEQFENIKLWFPKILKVKRFEVTAVFKLTYGDLIETIASSPEISKINQDLIEGIKLHRTLDLIRKPLNSVSGKSLFTAEAIFKELDPDRLQQNVFNQSEHDILELLLYKSRNRKQLEYLSGKLQSDNSKLRFTLSPLFGFLFFVEGNEKNHFAWELLNSHATYIWSWDKSKTIIEIQYQRIEEELNTIREIGRKRYKSAYKENQLDHDFLFNLIDHKKIDSDLSIALKIWQRNLNAMIL